MFTGLIREIGIIEKIIQTGPDLRITINAPATARELSIGESVAVHGICLTVTSVSSPRFTVDATAETLRVTGLGKFTAGRRVNLEPALRLNDRLGGHLMTGHIDGTGMVINKTQQGNAVELFIDVPENLHKYIVFKGSVALDGVSLTVAEKTPRGAKVVIIPHTAAKTALLEKKPGDPVHIECDIIAKYLEGLLAERQNGEPGLCLSKLKETGFLV
ncbi:MAG: riboflavin synthase [Bacillota bacterium]